MLTPSSKQKLLNQYQNHILTLQKEIEQLRFEIKKVERKTSTGRVREGFDREIHSRREKINVIEFQLEQLEILPIGTELTEREVDSIQEVSVGDILEDVTNTTIVVKDGIITEIR
ncbi:hypothetical protein Q73_05495 [Bacillus coahuilensis m2-6]|nr:hypothetical protein Q73_05495 [Bacillus coahuilensis m2-6]